MACKLPQLQCCGPPSEAYEPSEKPPYPHTALKMDHQPVKRWSSDVGNKLDYLTHRVTEGDAKEAQLGANTTAPGAFRHAECVKTMGKSGPLPAFEEGGPQASEGYPEYKAYPVLTHLYKIDETGDYIVPPSLRHPLELTYGARYRSQWPSTPYPHRLQHLKDYWRSQIVCHKTPERQRQWERDIGAKFPSEEEMEPEKRDCQEQIGELCFHRKCLQSQEAKWKANSKTPYTCPFYFQVAEPELRAKAARMDFPLNHMDAVYANPHFPLHEWNCLTHVIEKPERHPQNMPDEPWPPVLHQFSLWEPPWMGKEKPDLSRLYKYSFKPDHKRPLWRSSPAYVPSPYQKAAWGTGLAPGYPLNIEGGNVY